MCLADDVQTGCNELVHYSTRLFSANRHRHHQHHHQRIFPKVFPCHPPLFVSLPRKTVASGYMRRLYAVDAQNIRRELSEKRFTAELNVEASWKLLNDVGCDATQIPVDCSEDGEVPGIVLRHVEKGPSCKLLLNMPLVQTLFGLMTHSAFIQFLDKSSSRRTTFFSILHLITK